MHIGLYFGSFNPIHYGHISIAKRMLSEVGFDEVWLVVSPQNPLKESVELASNGDRLAMVDLAIGDLNLPIKSCDVEFELPNPSYTIDTLRLLLKKYPTCNFSLIMGSDNVAVIEKWKSYQEILELFPIYFYPRTGDNSALLVEQYGVNMVNAEVIDISSTQVRDAIAKGEFSNSFIPNSVMAYIKDKGLYQ